MQFLFPCPPSSFFFEPEDSKPFSESPGHRATEKNAGKIFQIYKCFNLKSSNKESLRGCPHRGGLGWSARCNESGVMRRKRAWEEKEETV